MPSSSSHVAIGAIVGMTVRPLCWAAVFAMRCQRSVLCSPVRSPVTRSERSGTIVATPSSVAFSTIRSIFEPFGIACATVNAHGRFASAAFDRLVERRRSRALPFDLDRRRERTPRRVDDVHPVAAAVHAAPSRSCGHHPARTRPFRRARARLRRRSDRGATPPLFRFKRFFDAIEERTVAVFIGIGARVLFEQFALAFARASSARRDAP